MLPERPTPKAIGAVRESAEPALLTAQIGSLCSAARILRLRTAATTLQPCAESLATLVVRKQRPFYSTGCDVLSIEGTTPPALPL